MTAAQKTARANFKKAIEYRKKTGCTLKQAFAKFKKPSTKNAAKKAVKKVVRKKAIVKKVARKKVSGIKTKSKKHTDYNKPTVNIQIGSHNNGVRDIIVERDKQESILQKFTKEYNRLQQEKKITKDIFKKGQIGSRIDNLRFQISMYKKMIQKNNKVILTLTK